MLTFQKLDRGIQTWNAGKVLVAARQTLPLKRRRLRFSDVQSDAQSASCFLKVTLYALYDFAWRVLMMKR